MNVFERYQQHITDTEAKLAVIQRSIQRNALIRLAVIVFGGVGLFMSVQTTYVWLVLLVFFAVLVSFMGLVWRQSKLEARRVALTDFLAVNQNEVDMATGKPNVYPNGEAYRDARHPYTGDLDIYGSSSLFAMVNRCATLQGNALLAEWFASPADRATIVSRQEAVQELAGDVAWCQQLQSALWFNSRHRNDFKQQFANFLKNDKLTFGNRYMRGYVRVAPWLIAAGVGTAIVFPAFTGMVVFLAVVHLLVVMAYGAKVNAIANQVGKAGKILATYAVAFERIENRIWHSPLGKKLQASLSSDTVSKPVSAVFSEFAGLIDRLDYRLNMLVGAVLNMAVLWDFKQVFALMDWRERYGEALLQAFGVVAETEALVSLATLSRNRPHWVFPEIVESDRPVIKAEALSHPLISPAVAVPNDYRMDDHRVALITGSNMAGKSTFLRTVGCNAVLACSGAPVCASSMQLSVFRLITYMRIADSLNENVSTFKAELDRIQRVLQTVRAQQDTFFLLDELLRGTNSKDKYLGSKAIIKQLIADGGSGMVATHDLQLADLSTEYPGVLANYHFDIQVRDSEMLFDYQLKSGACTIFNASLLLKGIGIEV